jgi:GH24 family phage-related lysozyme (muramidase)
MAGGCDRSDIVGQDQLLLCLCLFIYPEVQADEIAMFIYKNGGDVYENSVILRQLKDLQLTGKCASTEAYQAFTPQIF